MHASLPSLVPNADDLLALDVEEIAGVLLIHLNSYGSDSGSTAVQQGSIYLRLIDSNNVTWENRAHFFGIAARVMRRILVDHARQHRADKRGGEFEKVPIDAANEPASKKEDVDSATYMGASIASMRTGRGKYGTIERLDFELKLHSSHCLRDMPQTLTIMQLKDQRPGKIDLQIYSSKAVNEDPILRGNEMTPDPVKLKANPSSQK